MDPQQRLVLASSIALWAHGNAQDGDAAAAEVPKNARRVAQGWATFVGLSQVEYPKLALAHAAGGLLRTSTRKTLNLIPCLRASVCNE